MHKVVLVHGFNKDSNDMKVLQQNLRKYNFDCILVDLPLTFKKVEHCAFIFEGIFDKLLRDCDVTEQISLVGHSTGGLVIRKFLSDSKHFERVYKCILIATPNHGTPLADYAWNISKTYVNIVQTLRSLRPVNVENLQLKQPNIDIGAIAGNKNKLLLGNLLKNENDGRVEVQSVYYEGLKEFIILPYGHKDIHYHDETANLISHFIKHSKFK